MIERIAAVLVGATRGEAPVAVLCGGQEVEARVRVEGDILVAGDVGVQERGRARPVLGRGRRVEQARQRARGACAPEHVAGRAGRRIARWRGGEREEIDRILLVLEMAGVARGLREAVVEAALAAAGDVDQRAIEGHAPGLVHVQRLPQHVLDHPAGLGDAEDQRRLGIGRAGFGQGVARPGRVRTLEPEERDGVADRGEAEPDDAWILRRVHDLVDQARLEPADMEHVGGIGHQPVALDPGEAPVGAGDLGARAVRLRAHAEAGFRRLQRDRRIAARVAPHERRALAPLCHDELGGHRSGDRLALLGGGRQIDLQAALAREHVPVPPAPEQAVTLLEQETVAGVGPTDRVVVPAGLVEHGKRAQIAAVADLVQETVIAAAEIGRPQQDEIGGEGDAPASVARRQLQVDDRGVARVLGIDREVQLSADPLIRADRAKRRTLGKRRSLLDLDSFDRGLERRRDQRDGQADPQQAQPAPALRTAARLALADGHAARAYDCRGCTAARARLCRPTPRRRRNRPSRDRRVPLMPSREL